MLLELAEDVKKEVSKLCDEYEIFISQSNSISLDSKMDNLNFAKDEISKGLGIRVIKDNKVGFAFTSDLNKITQTINQAIDNTKLTKSDENFAFSQPGNVKEINGLVDKKYDDLSLEEAIDYLKSVINTALDSGCEVTSSGFSASKYEDVILNSNGVSVSNKGTGYGVGLSVNVEDGEGVSTAYDSKSSRTFNIDGDKLAEDVCKLAKDSVGGKHIETANKDVILDYHAAVGLLSTFISAFSAENVQRGRSILQGKLNTEIVSPNLSIIDDNSLEGALGSSNTDGEGTVSCRTSLVEKGILKSFLYDIYTANKEGCESTANGYRGSFSGTPSVSPSNLIFDFKDSVEISDMANGILATSVLGAHTANPISGDFSVEVSNAFEISNGDIGSPIKKAMISGNIFELLKDCEKVNSEIKQYGSFIIPQILVHNLRVVGQE